MTIDLLSMWEATATKKVCYPRLTGDHQIEVVVIGGGYSGLSTAYHLQEKGISCLVLEQGTIGSGASGRNGGEVLTGYLGTMESWANKKGLAAAKEMWHMSLDAIDLVEHLIQVNDMDCDFIRQGDLYAAYRTKHLEEMKREQAFMAEKMGYEKIHIVDQLGLQEELATTFYVGGRVDESSAHFHPYKYILGLAKAATQLGAQIFEQSEALHLTKDGKGNHVINTRFGRVFAKEVVLVTNAYAGTLNEQIRKSIIPIESIMIATEVVETELLEELIKKNRAVADSKELLYYFRRTVDNRLAFGGSGRASSQADRSRLFSQLHNGMLAVFPQLATTCIEYQWGGKVGFTPTMLPMMGRLSTGAYYAFGYGGHGAAMSSYLGKELARSIVQDKLVKNPLAVSALQPFAFHSQYELGVSLAKWYKKLQDTRFFKK